MARLIPTLTAAAGIVAAASGGPLERSRVPADVTWVVHMDMEAAMRSSVIQECLETREAMALDELDHLDEMREEFGLDPLHDILDATVFGRAPAGDDAVALVTTTAALDGAMARLKEEHEHELITVGGYEMFAWSDGESTQYGMIVPAAGDLRRLYLSKDSGRLIEAAEVGAGRRGGLRAGPGTLVPSDPGEGAVLVVAADVMPRHGHAESMVLGKAKAVRLEAGERDGECYAELVLKMGSSEDATNVAQIIQGMRAMARMFCQSNEDLAPMLEILDAHSMTAKEDSIFASFRYPASKVIQAIESATEAEKKEAEPEAGAVPRNKRPL